MANDFAYEMYLPGSTMDLFEDTQYLHHPPSFLDLELDTKVDNDVLAQYSSASFLASDDPATDFPAADFNQRDSVGSVPDIIFSPPTRTNTVYIKEQETEIEDKLVENDYRPWEAPGIGIAKASRDAAQNMVVAGSLSTAPSDAGTSQTSFVDSGIFSSLQSCEQCGAVYRNNSNRRKHILTHTKPHVCRYGDCKRHVMGFATPNDLDRHDRSVHKNGLEKWWKCAFPGCQKTSKSHCFDRKDNFIAHIKRRHKDLLTSAIDDLVNRSAQHPTLDEIQAARVAKETKPPSRRSSSTRGSTRGSTRESIRNRTRQKTKSETPSMRSQSPRTSIEPPSPSNLVFPSSAPTGHQTMDSQYFGGMSDLPFLGGAAEMSEQQVTMRPDNHRAISLQTGLPSMSPSYDPMPDWTSFNNMGRIPAQFAALQPFQALPSQQFIAGRSFESSLSDQMNFQNNQLAMQGSFGQMQDMQSTPSFQSTQSGYSPISTDVSFQSDMFSAGARPDASFNQPQYQQAISPTSTFESQSQYDMGWQGQASSPFVDMEGLNSGSASFHYPNPLDEG